LANTAWLKTKRKIAINTNTLVQFFIEPPPSGKSYFEIYIQQIKPIEI